MSKVKLNAILISDQDNINIKTTGIKTKNKIVYKENNVIVTIFIEKNKIIMKRNCNEYEILLNFENNKKTISEYKVFGGTKKFDLETFTKNLIICDNKISFDYELEGNKFNYILNMGGNYVK